MSSYDMAFATSTTNGSMPDTGTGHSPKFDEQAIDVARKALAKANSAVAQDQRNNSPDCVAFDQKAADKAGAELARATAQARADGVLDITV